jgi:hypothetical protein
MAGTMSDPVAEACVRCKGLVWVLKPTFMYEDLEVLLVLVEAHGRLRVYIHNPASVSHKQSLDLPIPCRPRRNWCPCAAAAMLVTQCRREAVMRSRSMRLAAYL